MVRWCLYGNTCVTKVKGHADEGLVALGRFVRLIALVIMKRMLLQIWAENVCFSPLFDARKSSQ